VGVVALGLALSATMFALTGSSEESLPAVRAPNPQAAAIASRRPRTWWYRGFPPHHLIPLRGERALGLAVAGGSVFTIEANARERTRLTRIDAAAGRVVSRRRVSVRPGPLVAFRGAFWAIEYAPCGFASQPHCSEVKRIDLASGRARVHARIVQSTIGSEDSPRLFAAGAGALWAAAEEAYPGIQNPGNLWRIDAASGRVAATPLSSETFAIAVTGGIVWLAQSNGTIERADAATARSLREPIDLGDHPAVALVAAPTGLWAATASALLRIDSRTGRIVARIPAGPSGFRPPLTAGARWVWISTGDGKLLRIDSRSNKPGRALQTGNVAELAVGHGSLWALGSSHSSERPLLTRFSHWRGWGAKRVARWCSANQLRADADFQGATGSLLGGFGLTNISAQTCTVAGTPHLTLNDTRGRAQPLVATRGQPSWEFQPPPGNWPFVTLLPRASTSAPAQWWNWCFGPSAVAFRLRLAHSGATLTVPAHAGPRCDSPSSPSSIGVLPFGSTP
jgi:hypothetical protein